METRYPTHGCPLYVVDTRTRLMDGVASLISHASRHLCPPRGNSWVTSALISEQSLPRIPSFATSITHACISPSRVKSPTNDDPRRAICLRRMCKPPLKHCHWKLEVSGRWHLPGSWALVNGFLCTQKSTGGGSSLSSVQIWTRSFWAQDMHKHKPTRKSQKARVYLLRKYDRPNWRANKCSGLVWLDYFKFRSRLVYRAGARSLPPPCE